MSNSTNPYANRRKQVNPYGRTNQSLQTGYSQQGDTVEPNPLPYAQQNRPGHLQDAKVVREGLDPTIFDRKTQKFDFAVTNMPNNSYLDMCVLNVTRATGTVASLAPVSIAVTPAPAPTIPANPITSNPEAVSASITSQAGTPRFPIPGGAGSNIASLTTGSTFTPASIGEFYKVASFGHAELPTATAGVTYELWVDSRLMMSWTDFQWSPVTPKRDMWDFDVPIFVEKQIVFRVINATGAAIVAGEMEACFAGWSEQKMGFIETDKVQIQNLT